MIPAGRVEIRSRASVYSSLHSRSSTKRGREKISGRGGEGVPPGAPPSPLPPPTILQHPASHPACCLPTSMETAAMMKYG